MDLTKEVLAARIEAWEGKWRELVAEANCAHGHIEECRMLLDLLERDEPEPEPEPIPLRAE